MVERGRDLGGRVRRQVRSDLRADPYLPYVLLLAAVLSGFWFWHRVPNFATRDEASRLLDVVVAFGTFLADPGVESLRAGVTWGRVPFGATFYLFGLALLPVLLAAALFGQLDAFLAFQSPDPTFGYWAVWHGTPAWVWTWYIALVRLFNVAFAVGSVYLTYRLGVELRDRSTGRLAALLLTFTFGFQTIAHEGGEDMPALFFVLAALALLVAYVRSGESDAFLAASAAGGVAIAFKLTAAPVVLAVGVAFLLRAHRAGPPWRDALVRPWLLGGGAALGLLSIALGFPTLLVGDAGVVVGRFLESSAHRTDHTTGPDAPIWWWFLRQYFHAFGLPLFVGTVGGVLATFRQLRDRSRNRQATALVLATLATYVAMLSPWHDFRLHHLLPTFPLLVLLLAAALVGFREQSPAAARVLIALLVVSGGIYATVGVVGYASMPRDEAVEWLDGNAEENDTIEVYRVHVQDTAVPHRMAVRHRWNWDAGSVDRCPRYVQLGYRDLLYLDRGTYLRNDGVMADYVRGLLEGEYNYEVAAEFGPRPPNYVPERPRPGSVVDLLEVGTFPQTGQYADEQELRTNQYTVVLERTGPCGGSRPIAF